VDGATAAEALALLPYVAERVRVTRVDEIEIP
jgi:hypothetical protein